MNVEHDPSYAEHGILSAGPPKRTLFAETTPGEREQPDSPSRDPSYQAFGVPQVMRSIAMEAAASIMRCRV